MSHVIVLGGGIVGVSTALALARQDVARVTIVSKAFTPHTTADGAAGFWWPHCLGEDTPVDDLLNYCRATMSFLSELYFRRDLPNCGIGLMSVYMLYDEA